MTKTPILFAAGLMAALTLSACGSASDETTAPAVPVPPPTVTETDAPTPPEPPIVEEIIAENDAHDHDDHEGEAHDEHDHEDHEEHDHSDGVGEAHVHGASEMAVIVEGNTLSISFGGPLANVLGFEYEPKTDEEKQASADLQTMLKEPANLVAIPTAAACAPLERDVSIRRSGTHGSLEVGYNFECANIDAIKALDFTGFTSFSGLETVDAIVITPAGQTAASLTASKATLTLPE